MKQHLPLLVCLFTFCIPLQLSAQREFGMHLQYNQQYGALREQGLQDGWGLNTEMMSAPFVNPYSALRLQLGARFDISFTGDELTGLVHEDPNGQIYDIAVTNANLGGYGVLRLSRETGRRVQPYLDGLLGARWFFSSEGIDHPDDECPEYDETLLASKVTPSWGGGLGVMVHLSEVMALDFRATYLQGERVSFVDLASIQILDPNRYDYTIRSARASQLMFQVGVNLLLTNEVGGAMAGGLVNSGFSSFCW